MKTNPEQYAKQLIRTVGLEHAAKIARKALEASKVSTWADLPIGDTFFTAVESMHKLNAEQRQHVRVKTMMDNATGKTYPKSYVFKIAEKKAQLVFWTNVYGHLNNKLNPSERKAVIRVQKVG